VLPILTIRGDEGVATAAGNDRNFIYGGTTYHDSLDPRTGWPAAGTQSVTEAQRDAATAQTAASAHCVAGHAEWVTVARALGSRYALLVDDGGAVHPHPELHARSEPLDTKAACP
jgi:thiamine biosynthesis lipoprotein